MNAPERAKLRRAAEVKRRRAAELLDAQDYLFFGDLNDRHKNKCVHALAGAEPCCRDYDPLPYPDALPDPYTYAGTGVGALYGLPNTEGFLWQTAGWNIVRRRREMR